MLINGMLLLLRSSLPLLLINSYLLGEEGFYARIGKDVAKISRVILVVVREQELVNAIEVTAKVRVHRGRGTVNEKVVEDV